jgi:hypothetical protein
MFREPLWVPSSLVKSPEDKCSAGWDAVLYRGWVFVGGVCGGQQGSGENCYERKRHLLEVGGCSAAVGETGGKECLKLRTRKFATFLRHVA